MPSIILRLLAGKFEEICTAFPQTTFLTKILREHPLVFFPPKNLNICYLEHQLERKILIPVF